MIEITKSFVLIGRHEKHLAHNKHKILVNPMYSCDYVFRQDRNQFIDCVEDLGVVGKSVADVGSGCGIVAIAVSRLGAGKVVAVEPCPEYADIARSNFALNELDIEIIADLSLTQNKFDIIISNIHALESYLQIIPLLESHLADDGLILLEVGDDLNEQKVSHSGVPIGMTVLCDIIEKSKLEIYKSMGETSLEYWYMRRQNA